MNTFLSLLSYGHLTFASNYATQKYHIVQLEDTAFDDDVRSINYRSKGKKAKKEISELDPIRKERWSAKALCGVKGETCNYGHTNKYYWTPLQNPNLDVVCKGCLKQWKKEAQPTITGWDTSATLDDVWPYELPFGWKQVPVVGHPWDVPEGGDPDLVKDGAGNIKGKLRTELRRFTRGLRIVRLVHYTDSDTYGARYWNEGADPEHDDWNARGTLKDAIQNCHVLMAKGGYP